MGLTDSPSRYSASAQLRFQVNRIGKVVRSVPMPITPIGPLPMWSGLDTNFKVATASAYSAHASA